jgi:hypothetical protein
MIVGALEDPDHDARASAQEMTDAEVVELPGLGHVGAWPRAPELAVPHSMLPPGATPRRLARTIACGRAHRVARAHGDRRPLRVASSCLLGDDARIGVRGRIRAEITSIRRGS